jgi:hypothetical protein
MFLPFSYPALCYHEQVTREFLIEQRWEMATYEICSDVSTCSTRAKENDALIIGWRIKSDVCDTLVHRKQDSMILLNYSEKGIVGATNEVFVMDGISLMTKPSEDTHNFRGDIFVEFELHRSATGNRLSSLASSAA